MLTIDTRRKLASGAVFGLPVIIVLVAGRVFGPQAVQADEVTTVEPVVAIDPTPVTAAPTPEVTAALDHLAAIDAMPFDSTPLYHPAQGETIIVIGDDPEALPAPEFTVKAILVASTGNIALIDGGRYRVGDELEDTGWEVITIDGIQRAVTVRDPETLRVHTRYVNGPSIPGHPFSSDDDD
jgi:hypothetical protein